MRASAGTSLPGIGLYSLARPKDTDTSTLQDQSEAKAPGPLVCSERRVRTDQRRKWGTNPNITRSGRSLWSARRARPANLLALNRHKDSSAGLRETRLMLQPSTRAFTRSSHISSAKSLRLASGHVAGAPKSAQPKQCRFGTGRCKRHKTPALAHHPPRRFPHQLSPLFQRKHP